MGPEDLRRLMTEALDLQKAGRFKESRLPLGEVLTAYPGQPDALNFMAIATLQLGEAAKALNFAKKALSVQPNNPFAFCGGDLEGARGTLEEVIEDAGPDVRFLHSLGLVLDRLDQSTEAFAALTKAHEQEAQTPAAIAMDRTAYPGMIDALHDLVNQGLGDG